MILVLVHAPAEVGSVGQLHTATSRSLQTPAPGIGA
jgi:hypothetical protein